MKKSVVIFLFLLTLGCALWYYQGRQQEKAEELIWAAYDGDLTGVKNALEDGAQTNWVLYINDPERHYQNAEFFPLLAAASGGNKQVILYLIRQGENPNDANSQGWTPLFVAVRDSHAESAAQLVHSGADPNLQTDTGATPLMMALLAEFKTEKERLSLLQYLLKRGADPNVQSHFGTDALFYAVTELKSPKAVKLLLEYQADPCRRYAGKTLPALADKKVRASLTRAYQAQCAKKPVSSNVHQKDTAHNTSNNTTN